jgi:Zn-dependent protease with chaperone function
VLDSLANKNERIVLVICAVYSALVYLVLIATLFGIPYLAIFALFFAVAQGLALGHLRGNGVRVTARQFPTVHAFATEIAQRMKFASLPDIYVVQEGGILNAFATRFFGRNFVVIYSDILELAMERGEAAVAFVVAHEMAHLYRKHTIWRSMLYPAMTVPMLGVLYSRCCEYTADAIGTACVPHGAGKRSPRARGRKTSVPARGSGRLRRTGRRSRKELLDHGRRTFLNASDSPQTHAPRRPGARDARSARLDRDRARAGVIASRFAIPIAVVRPPATE